MLWALISSAYVLYLYRTLGRETPDTAAAPDGAPDNRAAGIRAELDAVNQRLAALERQIASTPAGGTSP